MYGVLAVGGTDELDASQLACLASLSVAAAAVRRLKAFSLATIHYPLFLLQGAPFAGESDDPALFASLRRRCEVVMAQRAPALAAAARDASAGPAMLTAALRRVLKLAPASLAWCKTRSPGDGGGDARCCVEAVGAACDGGDDPTLHLYSLNLLTGTVLLNGTPPSRLPASIREHPLFVRVFGANHDFEVSALACGGVRTSRPLHGSYFYEFRLHDDATLEVAELRVGPDGAVCDRLELLDATGAAPWAADLPDRLFEMHSHWLARGDATLLSRPVEIGSAREASTTCRDVSFIALLSAGNAMLPLLSGGGGDVIIRVPPPPTPRAVGVPRRTCALQS